MRILVCGGRDFTNRQLMEDVLFDYLSVTTVIIEGGARGADRLARQWAEDRDLKVETFEADWDAHGRSAGPIRNSRMLEDGKPDLVIAFPGEKGTKDMVTKAKKAGVKVIEVAS